MSGNTNRDYKRIFRDAFYEMLDEKNENLCKIYENGYKEEAMLLCCCYIDALANEFYQGNKSGTSKNFTRVLQEHCNEEILSYISRGRLCEELQKLKDTRKGKDKKTWDTICTNISPILRQANDRLYSEQEILDLCAGSLDDNQIMDLRKELWRGSIAALFYFCYRNESVHGFRAPSSGFSKTTFKGKLIPKLGFEFLQTCLEQLIEKAKQQLKIL